MKYVTLVSNTDGGYPAIIHDDFATAKEWVRSFLTDPENDPPIEDDERERMERELAELSEDRTDSVRGSDAWKEWVYVAPLSDVGK